MPTDADPTTLNETLSTLQRNRRNHQHRQQRAAHHHDERDALRQPG